MSDTPPTTDLAARREVESTIRCMEEVVWAERRGLQSIADPERDRAAWDRAVSLWDDPNLTPPMRMRLLKMIDGFAARLDDRGLAIIRNQIERIRAEAELLRAERSGPQQTLQQVNVSVPAASADPERAARVAELQESDARELAAIEIARRKMAGETIDAAGEVAILREQRERIARELGK